MNVVCPYCESEDCQITAVTVFMGNGLLDINVIDAQWKYHDDPEPDRSYKIPSVGVGFDCPLGHKFSYSFGTSVDCDGTPICVIGDDFEEWEPHVSLVMVKESPR